MSGCLYCISRSSSAEYFTQFDWVYTTSYRIYHTTSQLSNDRWVPGKQISKESGTVRSTYLQNLSPIEIIRLMYQPLQWAFSELHSKLPPVKYLTVPGLLEFIKMSPLGCLCLWVCLILLISGLMPETGSPKPVWRTYDNPLTNVACNSEVARALRWEIMLEFQRTTLELYSRKGPLTYPVGCGDSSCCHKFFFLWSTFEFTQWSASPT